MPASVVVVSSIPSLSSVQCTVQEGLEGLLQGWLHRPRNLIWGADAPQAVELDLLLLVVVVVAVAEEQEVELLAVLLFHHRLLEGTGVSGVGRQVVVAVRPRVR